MPTKPPPTRIVATPTGLVIGLDKNGVFKPGMLYNVRRVAGEFILTEVGPSSCERSQGQPNWNMNAFDMVETGEVFVTTEEINRIRSHA